MRIPLLLFGLLLGMGLVLGYLLFMVPETDVGHGFTHPDYPTMQRGGDGAVRHEAVLAGGRLLGTLMILFMVGLLAFGSSQGRKIGGEEIVMILGTVVFVTCFLFTVATYRSYAAQGGGALALSFPIPTAWMLYGIWGAPIVFMLLYMVRFEPWIISDADIEKFLAETAADQER
ncbi:MAG: hypothetical protein VYE73_00135 [Acidobacteriota bacterium]|nr:hypothetical protein [Acidobacteriota bacterium]